MAERSRFGDSGDAPGKGRQRRGNTLIETLVVVAVIGGLAGLLLPAVQQARESSRRTTCVNNLRQIGIGFHNFHAARDCFPAGVSGNNARFYWVAQILPYLDENPLAGSYDYTVACNDIKNLVAVQTPLPFMRCPSVAGGPLQDPFFKKTGSPTWSAAAADYAGSSGPSTTLWNAPTALSTPKPANTDGFMKGTVKPGVKGRGVRFLTDGTSTSIAVVEAAARPQVWAFGQVVPDSGLPSSPSSPVNKYSVTLCGWADANQFAVKGFDPDPAATDPAARYTSPGTRLINGSNNSGIYAFHPGGAHVLYADGSSRFLEEATSADIVAAQLTVQGADAAGLP